MTIHPRLHRIVVAQPYPLLFATISGAHLYGFSSPNSDCDLRVALVRLNPALPPEAIAAVRIQQQCRFHPAVKRVVSLKSPSRPARGLI